MALVPLDAVLFDFGHTLVDFHRTEEALRAAYEQIRARIEAVAFMEVHELLDLIERVAGGVDRLVEESYAERRMEVLNIADLFREALGGIGDRLLDDVGVARGVGMRTILTHQFRQEVDPTVSPVARIQSLAELPAFLRD